VAPTGQKTHLQLKNIARDKGRLARQKKEPCTGVSSARIIMKSNICPPATLIFFSLRKKRPKVSDVL
jgi:hypothetical protein